MKKVKMMVTALGVLGGALMAEAHLNDGSLTVKAGDKFKVGDVVNVKWTIGVAHQPGDFDISLSTNGGTTFQKLETKKFPTSPGTVTYAWTVPNNPSSTAQIQICQHDGTKTCEYMLKSGNFAIEAPTSVASHSGSINSPAVRFDAASRNLEVSFSSAQNQNVLIQAFDAQGKVKATLLDGQYAAGSHKVSIFSNRLAASGNVVFRMQIGDQVHSLGWNGN